MCPNATFLIIVKHSVRENDTSVIDSPSICLVRLSRSYEYAAYQGISKSLGDMLSDRLRSVIQRIRFDSPYRSILDLVLLSNLCIKHELARP